MLLPLLALVPIVGAFALASLPNRHRVFAAWLAGASALLALGLVLLAAPPVFAGQVLRWSIDWAPSLGLSLGFRMDGLAWLFALLICGIGALVVLYAAYYLDRSDPAARFFQFLLGFMAAMLGVVLADNLLLLVVFWEATSLASFLLIGFWNTRLDARDGAKMALAVTGGGGIALLAGVLLLGHIVGSYQLDDVLAAGERVRAHALYLPALVLVLLGAFTKSAQFPFHFWLPQAMAAPTPVSAYLHSATLVKAGIFLMARLYPVLGHSEPWFWIVTLTGLTTLLLGAYVAIFQHDLKGLLAYSTISHLGLITLLLGLDQPLAIVAAVFHVLNHATFKASLFMAAGIIDHETGSRDMRKLNGLWKYLPWTGALAMIASAAMAGVPLLNGFLSKEMFFGAAIAQQPHAVMEWLLPIGATLAGVFSVAYSARFIHDVFFNGEPVGLSKVPHEPPRFMRIPVEVLAIVCVAVGIAPALTVAPLLAVGARAVLGTPLPSYSLALWHGFNGPLAMSAIALAGGALLYVGLQRVINLHRIAPFASGARRIFTATTERVVFDARRLTEALQTGRLQRYLAVLVMVALLAGAVPMLAVAPALVTPATPLNLPLAIAIGLGIVATIGVVASYRDRVRALIFLGAVGLIVAWLFVVLSAPDLALTQLLVEVVTIVLLLLALRWLPRNGPIEQSSTWRRSAQAAIAIASGLGFSVLVWQVLALPYDPISSYYLRTAVPLAGGSNAVNVILVDYRGFDTLGEITVLAIAALVIDSLLSPIVMPGSTPRLKLNPSGATSLMLGLSARFVLPFALLVAIHFLVRGHNQPGGGFVAGLLVAIALILQVIAQQKAAIDLPPRRYVRLLAFGLMIALATGLASLFVGFPFLTSTTPHPVVPLIGELPLASAGIFDLGVFLTVVGASMLMLLSIARLRVGQAP